MCGICGILDRHNNRPIESDTLKKMADAIVHRGPDDEGYWHQHNVGFGFRRLSIIDLSTGNQPLFNEDRSIVVVSNGEIYNYKELTSKLSSKGHVFRTHVDIEVIVHAYEEYGDDFVKKLNGQFAIALYDSKRRRFLLARDHTGIAPLFYAEVNGSLIFASEIKSLLKYPGLSREIDFTTLDQIITFPGMVSPRTMFKQIKSMPPGHYMVCDDNGLHIKEYWDLVYPERQAGSLSHPVQQAPSLLPDEYYLDRLDELLEQAVRRRLQADVPVGFYMSGGLDSSIIASYIHRLHPAESFHSFSIGFKDARIDERKYQQIMVDKVKSKHKMFEFDWAEIGKRLRKTIYHAECPIRESYDTCTMALAELVHNTNLKVVLTGEGSDELFAGYVGYRLDLSREVDPEDMFNMEYMLDQEIRKRLWGDENFFYEKNLYEFQELKRALYADDVSERLAEFDVTNEPFIDVSKVKGKHPIHQRSYLDFKLRIADHLLADHGDRMSFASSVEGRFPFLDVELIEFVTTIPPELLVKDNVEKYLLKKLGKRILPPEITNREKFAFVAPGSPWLLRQNVDWVNDLLSYDTIKGQGYFNPDTIERLKATYTDDKFDVNQTFETDLLMIVLTFGIFLEEMV